MEKNFRISQILLVFDNFDPVSNYTLRLVQEANQIVSFDSIIFLYHPFKPRSSDVFQGDEKILLLASTLPKQLNPQYLIDGDSFHREEGIMQKINSQIKKHPHSKLYLLLDLERYKHLSQTHHWQAISASTQIILYSDPGSYEELSTYSISSRDIIFINPSKEISALKHSSIIETSPDSFTPDLMEVMNHSENCAKHRVQNSISERRYKHCLRVAATAKEIFKTIGEEDEELKYNTHLAALYHDICKEIPRETQETIATTILGIEDYPSWKVLHGPIASWLLRTKYSFKNQDILEAITYHTQPNENPKKITIFLHLADRLEPAKKDIYPEEVYNQTWDLIEEKKPVEAFYFLVGWCNEQREKKRLEVQQETIQD